MPPFVSWIFAAWTRIHRRFPIVSVTMCRFLPFVFFPRHIRDFLRNTLFLRSVNQSVRNSVLHSFLLVFVLLWQGVSSFCPIRRYFLLGDKNSIQYHAADSHAAAFSIGSLSLRYTALPLPMISYDICFYFRMERILWLLPIAHLSNHFRNLLLHTLFHVSYYITFSLWTQALKQTATANGAKYH